jgi:hypothetical protein
MKRGILFILSFILLSMSFVMADNETSVSSEQIRIDKAYKCLEDKIGKDCSTSLIDNIFILLAIKKCGEEVKDKSNKDLCWPNNDCSIKTTAQAVLALDKAGYATYDAETWLLNQNGTPSDIYWYLEIESSELTTCEIKYDSNKYLININEDKKISSSAGGCLTLSEGDYWLRILPTCYDKTFEISCDKSFLTTLLFKKKNSPIIHISEKTSSASAEGTTTENIFSLCFMKGNNCDYAGSLWATLVLNSLGYNPSPFIPYLVAMADENKNYLPEAFLYPLTGYTDFRADLLLKQKKQYWDESGDKFYDTALALYPLINEDFIEKDNSKKWLLEIQGKDGCWDNGNIKNNAFILASLWPKSNFEPIKEIESKKNCEDSGYYCMSEIECNGNLLQEYECPGVSKCCDVEKIFESCEDQGGETCISNQVCSEGITVSAKDIGYGEICCVGGRCEEQKIIAEPDCESNQGICKTYGCDKGEEESFLYTCDYGDSCCIKLSEDKNLWWIWLLLILIILIIISIVFRDRLRPYFFKFKSKFKKENKNSRIKRPLFRKNFNLRPSLIRKPQAIQRKILPPSSRISQLKKPLKKSSEVDEVLKKLKDMGN